MKYPGENITRLLQTMQFPNELQNVIEKIQRTSEVTKLPANLDSNLSAIYKLQQSRNNIPQINIPTFDIPKPPNFSHVIEAVNASQKIYDIAFPFEKLDAVSKTQIEQIANPLSEATKAATASLAALDMSKQLLPLDDIFKRFKELYENDQETAEAFSTSSWTIAPSMPKVLKNKVLRFYNEGKSRYVSNVIMGYYFKSEYANLKEAIEVWREHPLFKRRMQIVDDALEAHINGKYTLSIPALLPLVEGILNDYVKQHNLSVRCGKIKEVYEAVLGDPDNYSIVTWSVVETLLQQLRNNTYVYTNFEVELKKSDRQRVFSRHTVLHGIKTNYYSPSNSLRVFLLLDAISALHDDLDDLHKKTNN